MKSGRREEIRKEEWKEGGRRKAGRNNGRMVRDDESRNEWEEGKERKGRKDSERKLTEAS